MLIYVADAFTDRCFGGNPAGIVLLDREHTFPDSHCMQKLAEELKHSETAFVLPDKNHRFHIRYFTPVREVDLCGHATIAAFALLKQLGFAGTDDVSVCTRSGPITVSFDQDIIFISVAPAKAVYRFTLNELPCLYHAFGLTDHAMPLHMMPEIISCGLADILLPVKDSQILNHMTPDFEQIARLSDIYHTVGFHVFAPFPEPETAADCRNFAPLYGIDEEAATGTSSGGLTFYLYNKNLIQKDRINIFRQGTAMGRPSKIFGRITDHGIDIGGSAVILFGGPASYESICR